MQRTDLEQWKASEVARLLALVETERRYFQEIFKLLPVAVCIVQSDGSIVALNREFRRRFDLTHGEFSRSRIAEVLALPELERVVAEVAESGKAVQRWQTALGNPARKYSVSLQKTRSWHEDAAEEVLMVLEEAAAAIEAAPEAKPAGIPMGEAAAENCGLAMWILDRGGMTFHYANAEASGERGGREPWGGDALAWMRQYVHPADHERWLQFYSPGPEGLASGSLDYRLIDSGGAPRWVRDEARPLAPNGGTADLVSVVSYDRTGPRRQMEQEIELAKRAAVNRLAARVAHVANNLLMIIGGYTEELIESLPPGDARRADLAEIQKAGARLAGLTTQLATLKQPPAFAEGSLDLRSWLAAAPGQIQRLLPEDCVCEAVECAEALALRVNPSLLDQIISESIRALRPRMTAGARVVIEPRLPAGEPTGALLLRFSGVELSEEARQQFFEPFSGPKEHGPDPALGIAGLVAPLEQMGGMLTLESEPGEPLGLAIHLQRSQEDEAPEPGEEAVEAAGLGTIMLVEDEPGIRVLIRKTLQRQGYEVVVAGSPQQALELFQQRRQAIRLLVTDLMVPGMNGHELAGQLRQMEPELRVLYISGYTDDGEAESANGAGEAFLRKPFTLGALLEQVRELTTPRGRAAGA